MGEHAMRVLIVDDDEIARETMRQILERSACAVVAVENAIAGLAELQQGPFDAIVCDYRLPFMGGSTFYDEVRTEYPDAASRFIFVTGYSADRDVSDVLEGTGQPVFGKPFELEEFVRVVRSMGEGSAPAR